ncbi:MAG: phosphoglycerate dehydrogenase [Armatimonadia bacterium]
MTEPTIPIILVCDPLAEEGLDILREAGEVRLAASMSEVDLRRAFAEAEAIVVRSATSITAAVIEMATRCRVIARAGVGVDNIDVEAATRRGILVVNSPAGNILAAAEHAVALLMAAARCIPQGNASTKAGEWDRKSCSGRQIQGKTLGLVGLGNVGSEVAKRGRALGLDVIAYDPYITAERAAAAGAVLASFDEVLQQSDFLSLHAVASSETEKLIGAAQLARLKPGAILINTARGSLIDETALIAALREGTLAAAALDVFAEEPTHNTELLSLPNVIVTPHVGAMTHEAQINVALDAARQVVEVLQGKPARWPVNAPPLPPEALQVVAPFLPLAEALARLARGLLIGPLRRLEMTTPADLSPEYLGYVTATALAAVMAGITDETVNAINAPLLARERHIEVAQARRQDARGYTNLLELRLQGDPETVVAGALLDRDIPRIVGIGDYDLDLPPADTALLIWRKSPSRPGFIGRVGTLLGEAGVNISAIQVSHEAPDEVGLMALTVQSAIPDDALAEINNLDGVTMTRVIAFPERQTELS